MANPGNNTNPTGRGGFSKGRSGNPGGRPKVVAEIQTAARNMTGEVLARFLKIIIDDDADPRAQVAAGREILDRGWGKPTQMIDAKVNIPVKSYRGVDLSDV
jgi:hypothetical protein